MADLMDLYGGMGPGLGAMWAGQNQANKNIDSSLEQEAQQARTQDLMSRLSMAQERQPYDLAQLGASTAHTQEQTRGMQQTNDISSGVGIPLQVEAKAEELKNKMSKSSAERQESFLQDLARGMPFDSAADKHGVNKQSEQASFLRGLSKQQIQQIADNTSANREKRAEEQAKADREKENRRMEIASREKIAQMQIDAGRYNKTGSKLPQGMDEELAKAKGAVDKLAVVLKYRAQAVTQGDLEAADRLGPYIEFLKPLAEAELNKLKPQGEPDLSTLGIKTNKPNDIGGPGVQVTPQGQSQQPYGMGPNGKLGPADMQAMEWAKANQQDPRAAKILQKLKQEGKLQ